jgi:short-subunit dehydrogenase
MVQLSGKIATVTGARQGIGKEASPLLNSIGKDIIPVFN